MGGSLQPDERAAGLTICPLSAACCRPVPNDRRCQGQQCADEAGWPTQHPLFPGVPRQTVTLADRRWQKANGGQACPPDRRPKGEERWRIEYVSSQLTRDAGDRDFAAREHRVHVLAQRTEGSWQSSFRDAKALFDRAGLGAVPILFLHRRTIDEEFVDA